MPSRARIGVVAGLVSLVFSVPAKAAEIAAASVPAGTAPAFEGPFERLAAELPPWLKIGAEVRGRIDNLFGVSGIAGRNNSYYLHRLRLNTTISAASWLRLVMQFQDAREVGYDRSSVPYTVANSHDLRQAFVELGGSSNESPWAVRVGRQPLVFGDNRLVSTSNWGNVGPAFDAVRLGLRLRGARLDAFGSLVVVPCAGYDRTRWDKTLSGLYSSFDLPGKAGTADAYVFWKKNPQAVNLFTYGVRAAGGLPDQFNYNVEVALQRGRVNGQTASAWAGHWEIGRKFKVSGGSVRLALEYNYATGDPAPGDGRYQSFDPLYPTNVYATAADFGWRNLHEPAATAEWQPDRKTKIKAAYHVFWLAQRKDALYTFSGAVFAANANASDSHVGEEFDLRVIRQVHKHLQLWVGYAHLFAGPYLRQAGKGSMNYPYGMWTLSF